MPRRPITRLVDLCSEIGVEHIQVTELFRRIDRETAAGNDVIVQEFGTFYRKFNRERVRVLNGDTINVPANDRTALRGQRFPSAPAEIAALELRLAHTPGGVTENDIIYTRRAGTYNLELSSGMQATIEIQRTPDNGPEFTLDGEESGFRDTINVDVRYPPTNESFGFVVNLLRGAFGELSESQTGHSFTGSTRFPVPTSARIIVFRTLYASQPATLVLNGNCFVSVVPEFLVPDGAIDDDGFPT